MKIVVIGTRGIPNILGGVETHCEELFPRIASEGNDVTIIRRSCYVSPQNKITSYKGVKLVDVYAPRKKSIEAIIHTFLAIIKAKKMKPDILHIHAIGPALLTPMAKMLGMKVVMTHHGPDYDRQKWGKLAKTVLKSGERAGAKFSNKVIVISNVIKDILRVKHKCENTILIYNGVPTPTKSVETDYIESLGLRPKKYVLAVGRFVKEKNFHQLIEAFKNLGNSDYSLVIAGDSDHEDEYSADLKRLAKENNVTLTGFIKGEKLNQVLTNAALFVLPSSHEGLPISLLEAMSYNLDVLVSDIPANKLKELSTSDFFRVNDIQNLQNSLCEKLKNLQINRVYDLAEYNWDTIAGQTIEVYKSVLAR